MRLGLISDVHSSPAPLQQALQLLITQRVDKIICAGDIAGYHDQLEDTVRLLLDHDVDCIIGNHDVTYMQTHAHLADTTGYRFLASLPETLSYTFEGKRILVVHAQPPHQQNGGIKLLDENSQLIDSQVDYWRGFLAELNEDILIVGHTHQVYTEQLGNILVINPGSVPFNHSCMILQLPEMTVETYALEGKEILSVWNWGMLVRNQ